MSKTEQPSPYAKIRYNIDQPVDFDSGIYHSHILLAMAGADGNLAEEELGWYINELVLLGCTEEYISTVKNLDWRNANIEELLGKINFDFPMNSRKTILYQALKMCRADKEYHQKEREVVQKAAQILGIKTTEVKAIESLVEMEETADQLRYALLETIE